MLRPCDKGVYRHEPCTERQSLCADTSDGYVDMSIQEIERAVSGLSAEELSRFREWFFEFDAAAWDRQFTEDAESGRLDALADEALAELRSGRTRPL